MGEAKMNKKSKKRAVKLILIVLLVCLASFTAGYGVTASGLGEKAFNSVRQWFGWDHTADPPRSGDPPDPGDAPRDPGKDPQDPGNNPQDPGQDPGDPGEDPGNGDKPKEQVIYVGQVLLIPVPSGEVSSISQVVQRGTVTSSQKPIALTFDSGWLFEQTIPLLNVLDQYGVTATFFPRAGWVADHPELAREIVRRGHTMGNHSLTHKHMPVQLDAAGMRYEMQESTRIIWEVTGIRPYLFRPPYGEYNQTLLQVLGEEGYPYTVMWTIDTHDWATEMNGQTVTADYIVNRVLNNADQNGIVLMHIGGPKTVEALPRIIEGLRAKGFTFNTLDKMLPPPADGTVTHTVAAGETLYSIARRYGVTVQQLIEANGL